MNIRKITSMTMFTSFILLVITSVVLYIVPQGRVAYWADWHLWGLTKSEWSNLHINLGFLFLFAGLLHLFFNWSVIKAYMKNRAKELKVFTPSFNVAMLLCIVVGFGTYFEVPPMSTVINFGESIKDSAEKKYGSPPYGHAELSTVKLFAKKQGLDLDTAVKLLKDANIQFQGSDDTLASIASANGLAPQGVYDIIKAAGKPEKSGSTGTFPDSPMTGFGKMFLADLCSDYTLKLSSVIKHLEKENITAKGDMTIKEIASANNTAPMAIFDVLHGIANEMQNKH